MPNILEELGLGGELFQIFLYQLVGQVLGAALAPLSTEIQQCLYQRFPDVALSPAELADMVERAIISEQAGITEAALNGIDEERFRRLVQAAGEGPAPQELTVALRRKIIPEHGSGPDSTSFEQGIRESHLRNKWTPIMKALATQWPTPVDALDALLEGQVDEAAGRELYQRFGGDPEFFTLLYNTRGTAPTPIEAADMANRGLIPWEGEGPDVTSFRQAFLEGPWRNKWLPAFRKVAEYRPPARTITAMVRNGAITDDTALHWFQDIGATPDIAAAMLADAHHQKTQASKQLAASTALALWRDRLIDRPTAKSMLEALKYSAQDAEFELDLADFQATEQALRSAISRIHTLYVAHKIDKNAALSALNGLKIPPAHVDDVLTTWTLERQANIKVLTAGEIADAVYYSIIDLQTGVNELVAQGYSEQDAVIRISIRLHGKPPPTPPPATAPAGA